MLKSALIVLVACLGLVAVAGRASAQTKLIADISDGENRYGDAVYTEKPYEDGQIVQILEVKYQGRPGEHLYIYVDGALVGKVTADRSGSAYYGAKCLRREGGDDNRVPLIRSGSIIKVNSAHGFFREM